MGDWYSNLLVEGAEAIQVETCLIRLGRNAYIGQARGRIAILDQDTDQHCQPPDCLAFAALISRELRSRVLAVINVDDDVLVLAVFDCGQRQAEYWSHGQALAGVFKVAAAFGSRWLLPLRCLVLLWPFVVFEIFRHLAYAFLIGAPLWMAGLGYRYLDAGDCWAASDMSRFRRVAPAAQRS